MGPLTQLNQKASSLLNSGKNKEAIDFCNEIIESNVLAAKDLDGFYMYRGYAYANLGYNEKAISDLNKCISLIDASIASNPMYPELLEGLKSNVQKRLATLQNSKKSRQSNTKTQEKKDWWRFWR